VTNENSYTTSQIRTQAGKHFPVESRDPFGHKMGFTCKCGKYLEREALFSKHFTQVLQRAYGVQNKKAETEKQAELSARKQWRSNVSRRELEREATDTANSLRTNAQPEIDGFADWELELLGTTPSGVPRPDIVAYYVVKHLIDDGLIEVPEEGK
jgi:hypothetical protein